MMPLGRAQMCPDLPTLLQQADFVTLHVSNLSKIDKRRRTEKERGEEEKRGEGGKGGC